MKRIFTGILLLSVLFTSTSCAVKRQILCIAEDGRTDFTIACEYDTVNANLAVQKLKKFIDGVAHTDISLNGYGKQISFITDSSLESRTYKILFTEDLLEVRAYDDFTLYFAVLNLISNLRPVSGENFVGVPCGYKTSGAVEDIDNSSLIPVYTKNEDVTLEKSWPDGEASSPDWIKGLTIVEMRVETATEEGTLDAAVTVLDRLAQTGVNAVWLCPVYDGEYGNKGPQSVNPKLTGTSDYEAGWEKVAEFVRNAHARNIRVFLDIISWGVWTNSPLIEEHPDWFTGIGYWNGYDYDWSNEEMREWFIAQAVSIIKKTDADGFRCDLEPGQTGYEVYRQIRKRLYDDGYKIAIFSEGTNWRDDVYDFEQHGARVNEGAYLDNPARPYFVKSIRSAIRRGTTVNNDAARYSTYCLSMHDFTKTSVQKDRMLFGFSSVFLPHLPLWFLGEEYGMEAVGTLYYQAKQDLSLLENAENYAFYHDVKIYLRIKYMYPDIFCNFAEDFVENNVCDVSIEGGGNIGSYARWADHRGVMIIPNTVDENVLGAVQVTIPYDEMHITSMKIRLTDLMSEQILYEGDKTDFLSFTAYVAPGEIGVYIIDEY